MRPPRLFWCLACTAVLLLITGGWIPASALDQDGASAGSLNETVNLLLSAFSDLLPVLTNDLPAFIDHTIAIAEHPDDIDTITEEYQGMSDSIRGMYRIYAAVHGIIRQIGPAGMSPDTWEDLLRAEERYADQGLVLDRMLAGSPGD